MAMTRRQSPEFKRLIEVLSSSEGFKSSLSDWKTMMPSGAKSSLSSRVCVRGRR